MITGVLLTAIKIFMVFIILVAMIVILLSINRIISPERKKEDIFTNQLKDELENEQNVISSHSLFRRFLSDQNPKPEDDKK